MNKLFPLCTTAILALAACASTPEAPKQAMAELRPASGSTVQGNVRFTETPAGVRMTARVMGLNPGPHGFHIHDVGDCSAPDATSAKGHYNPTGSAHGSQQAAVHHLGDMPNLTADAQGNAELTADLTGLSIGGQAGNVVGRAVIIHADADDYTSQPAGNSGKRIACGVIRGE